MSLQDSLKKCKVEGNILFLPSEILPDYAELRKALIKAGAQYKRNKFVFPGEAQPYIDILMKGEITNIKKEYQFFETPSSLADRMVLKAAVSKAHKVLEPSAGRGALIEAAHRVVPGIVIDCCELMQMNRVALLEKPNINLIAFDFLELAYHENYYDRIIANPPFTKNHDIEHIRKMYSLLKKKGRMVSIASPSWKFGSQKKHEAFRDWLEDVDAEIEEIDKGAFKSSGTMAGGFIITINK